MARPRLRMSRHQANQLGLGDLLPPPAPPRRVRSPDGMTRLERSFRDDALEPAWRRGAIGAYYREPMKLRLAGRTFYTPDFLVTQDAVRGTPRRPTFIEVKGYMYEDARVKLKCAADLYPCFAWLLVYREGKAGWRVHEVTDRGISAAPIVVPWIHGG